MIERRVEVRPPWPFRLPGGGADGVLRARNGVLTRLVQAQGELVVVRVAQLAGGSVLFGARAERPDAAAAAIDRMRFALGVDDDLRPFHQRMRRDSLLGPLVRADPALRVRRRPEPFEALLAAITEQLIDYPRAAAIQRRIVWRLGARCPASGLRAPPPASVVAAQAPALLQSFDLSAARSLALVRAAREIAAGRIDLHAADHERGWRRLEAIPEIGPWTIAMLALGGQGRHDQVPAGDLNLLKRVGRLRTGDPRARATVEEVHALLAPYAPWGGLAASYLMRARGDRLPPPPRLTGPPRAGTRSSARSPLAAAA